MTCRRAPSSAVERRRTPSSAVERRRAPSVADGAAPCATPPGAERISTVEVERATSLLQAPDEDTFGEALLSFVGTVPTYIRRLGEQNLRESALLGVPRRVARPDHGGSDRVRARGAQVVGVRAAADFAAGHLPALLSLPLCPVRPTWVGRLAHPDTPLLLVRGPAQGRSGGASCRLGTASSWAHALPYRPRVVMCGQ